jgi:hypothetical protein
MVADNVSRSHFTESVPARSSTEGRFPPPPGFRRRCQSAKYRAKPVRLSMLFFCVLFVPPVNPTISGAINFETLPLAEAMKLDGQIVVAEFVVAHEPYETAGRTRRRPGR